MNRSFLKPIFAFLFCCLNCSSLLEKTLLLLGRCSIPKGWGDIQIIPAQFDLHPEAVFSSWSFKTEARRTRELLDVPSQSHYNRYSDLLSPLSKNHVNSSHGATHQVRRPRFRNSNPPSNPPVNTRPIITFLYRSLAGRNWKLDKSNQEILNLLQWNCKQLLMILRMSLSPHVQTTRFFGSKTTPGTSPLSW